MVGSSEKGELCMFSNGSRWMAGRHGVLGGRLFLMTREQLGRDGKVL